MPGAPKAGSAITGFPAERAISSSVSRFTRTLVHFLSRSEVEALLTAPDQRTWFGRRDHAFLLVAVQTGLRLSEMTGLIRDDVALGKGTGTKFSPPDMRSWESGGHSELMEFDWSA